MNNTIRFLLLLAACIPALGAAIQQTTLTTNKMTLGVGLTNLPTAAPTVLSLSVAAGTNMVLSTNAGILSFNLGNSNLNRIAGIGAGVSGDIFYHDGTGWTNLAAGVDGKVLELSGGFPSWQTDDVGVGGTGDDVWVNHGDVLNPNLTNAAAAEITWTVSGTNVWPVLASGITRDAEWTPSLVLDPTGILWENFFVATTNVPAWTEGRVFYDEASHTLSVYNDQPDVTVNLSQESHVRVVNKTGSTITNGSPVRILSAFGNRPTVELAYATNTISAPGCVIVGIMTHNLTNNLEGLVTTFGTVSDIDTSGWTAGDALYLDKTAGVITNVAPAGYHVVRIGYALNSTANGKIFVNPFRPVTKDNVFQLLNSLETGSLAVTNTATLGAATVTSNILLSALTPSRLLVSDGSSYITNSTLTEANVLTEAEAQAYYQTGSAALTNLSNLDGSYLTNSVPGGATNAYQLVTLEQLQNSVRGGEVLWLDNASPASGFSLTGTVGSTNYAAIALPDVATTNTAATFANGTYVAAYISTNTFSSIASGLAVVDIYAYEELAGSGSISAEVYVINSVTKAEEYEFTPSPAYQTVPVGSTPTLRTFSVRVTDYSSSTNFHIAVKIKVSESSTPDPTIRLVTGGSFGSHVSFALAASSFVKKSGDTMTGLLSVPALVATDSIKLSAATASKLAVFDGSSYLTNSLLTEASITENLTQAEADDLFQATNDVLTRVVGLPTTANYLVQTDGTGITNKAVGGDLTFSGGNFTVASDSVALTADTTGDYVKTAAGTTAEVEVTGAGTEGRDITIGLPANLALGTASFTAITNTGDLMLGTTNLLSFAASHLTEAEASALYQSTNSNVSFHGTHTNNITIFVDDRTASVPGTGRRGFFTVDFPFTLLSWTVLATPSGSATFDVKQCEYASFPTTASICNSAKAVLTSSTSARSNCVTLGWTTNFTGTNTFEFVLDSATTATNVALTLQILK